MVEIMDEIEKNILLSLYKIEANPGVWKKTTTTLINVLEKLGKFDKDAQIYLWEDHDHESENINEVYYTLIEMMNEENPLVKGQGKFGDEEYLPVHPRYTECCLTEAGVLEVKKME